MKRVNIEFLIKTIDNHLDIANRTFGLNHAGSCHYRLENIVAAQTLIKILEWELHGHMYPIDEGQPFTDDLVERLDWIKKAYSEGRF